MVHRFARTASLARWTHLLVWATADPRLWRRRHRGAGRAAPALVLAVKSASLTRIAGTLVETYSAAMQGGGCWPADRPRGGRPDRGGALVQRPPRLYPDHRQRTARPGDSAAQRLCRGGHLGDPRRWRRRAEADRRRQLGIFTAGDPKPLAGLRPGRRGGAPWHRRLNRRRAGDICPITETYLGLHLGEGVLRQYWQQGAARFHGGGAGRQRSQPDRRAVPLRRAGDAALRESSSPRPAATKAVRLSRALRAARRQHPQELFTLDPTASG